MNPFHGRPAPTVGEKHESISQQQQTGSTHDIKTSNTKDHKTSTMVENKEATRTDYQPLLERSSYEATTPTLASCEQEVAVATVYADDDTEEVQVQPSAPTEEDLLVHQTTTTGTARETVVVLDRDELAEAAAAEARQQGVNIIQSHAVDFFHQNPDANFVTWIATLHPENAEVTIDPRFHIPGNPWVTVYEEARAAAMMGVGFQVQVPQEHPTNHTSTAEGEETKNDDPPTGSTSSRYMYSSTTRNIYLGGLIPMLV